MSLHGAAVLEAAFGPYKGKQSGEPSLFRAELLDRLEAGDVLLADRYYASFWLIALLRARGVDCVMRQHQRRRAGFRAGARLDRKSTSLNSSHANISYAVFCLKTRTIRPIPPTQSRKALVLS